MKRFSQIKSLSALQSATTIIKQNTIKFI